MFLSLGVHPVESKNLTSNPHNLERCEIARKIVLFANKKFHTSYRLVPKSVALNDLEWYDRRYFALVHCMRHIYKLTVQNRTVKEVTKW